MWIKICGITSIEDAEAAIAAGVDALGFVFADSPRRMSPEAASKIATKLPKLIEKIGVFVDARFDEAISAIQTARLTGVQLHGDGAPELAERLHERSEKVGLPLHIIRALPCEPEPGGLDSTLQKLSANSHPPTILVDSRTAGKQGGTGIPFDWTAAQNVFHAHASHLRLVVAGGLNPENVGDAVRTLRPWGIDVSTGVEFAPGRKDRSRMTEFVRAACAAAVESSSEKLIASVHG